MSTKSKRGASTVLSTTAGLPVETWWRTYTPKEMREYKDDTEAVLALAEYVQTDPAQWLQSDGSLARNRELYAPGLIKTGLERLRTNIYDDVAGSWFLLAYFFDEGNSLTVLLMREMLLKLAREQSTEKGADARAAERRYLKLVEAWTGLVESEPGNSFLTENGLRSLNSNWRDLSDDPWVNEGLRSHQARRRREAEVDNEDSEPPVGTPVRVVVEAIGDPRSAEGRKVTNAYDALTGPLPLAGSSVSARTLGTALTTEFPWMKPAVDRLTDDLRLLQATGTTWSRFRPMLLVGPPGVGKTRFARKLARLLGTGYQEINAAGSSDNRMLAGTARGWSSAQPALPLLAMLRGRTANPVCVVDEIDKAGGNGRNGDMRATLLTLLEPETAGAWYDECLLASCDLSQVSWILTANDLKTLSAPLMSRLMVVHVSGLEPEHFGPLVEGILWDLCEELCVARHQLPNLEPEVIEVLREHFTRARSARKLKNAITAAMAHAMVKCRSRLN